MKKLGNSDMSGLLNDLPEWVYNAVDDSIWREFVFADFKLAWGFMSQVALMAEQHNHHPDWSNARQRVTIAWTTHDAGGLSMRDITAAHYCNEIGSRLGAMSQNVDDQQQISVPHFGVQP